MKVMTIFGTRPEAIKMCPLILEIKKQKHMECVVCLTGQHREMLRQVMDAFAVKEDYNLDIMKEGQTLSSITSDVLLGMGEILQQEQPDLVLVHGDTTTSFAAALAAFYRKIPVAHVEAGLRTGNLYAPYPEEMNRQMTARLASLHFAPTEGNRQNLQREAVQGAIHVVGNTVMDAFQYTVKKAYRFAEPLLNELDYVNQKVVVVTAHRRENLGKPLEQICEAIRALAKRHPESCFVYPVHLNKAVGETAERILHGLENVRLIPPMDVMDMHNLLARCYMVLTDSGGLQEEAPAFGKPVLVLRQETERPEAVLAGTVKVVGVKKEDICRAAHILLQDADAYNQMAQAVNPYGDGHTSQRIVEILSSSC
jgi:UDP-N-acetylglucosamine 2-epimerase (non-hydrolysing)